MKRTRMFCFLFSVLILLSSCSNIFTAPEKNEPERPTTTISFYVEDTGHVLMFISNTNLEPVKVLINQELAHGNHRAVWNGDNYSGDPVASGVYYYTLLVDGEVHMKTMLLIK